MALTDCGKGGFLVRMRGFFFSIVLFYFIFGMPPAIAASSSNASEQTAPTTNKLSPRCGATVADDVNRARQSLVSNTRNSERVALACIIEAIDKLDSGSLSATRSDGDRVLAVPASTTPVKPK